MEQFKARKPTYCIGCKYFEYTGVTHDWKMYELGGKCHNADAPHTMPNNYMNGGCNVCTMYEKACDGREIPEWMKNE